MSSVIGSTRVYRFLGWGAAASLPISVFAPGALQSLRRRPAAAAPRRTAAISPRRSAAAAPTLPQRRPAKRAPGNSAAIVFRKAVVVGIPKNVVQVEPHRPEVRVAVATATNLPVVSHSAARYRQQTCRLAPSGPPVVALPAGRLRG
jgi:hypothetical protein